MKRTQIGRTMEALSILAQIGEIDFVEKQKKILKNAYDPETQRACQYLTEEQKEELLFSI